MKLDIVQKLIRKTAVLSQQAKVRSDYSGEFTEVKFAFSNKALLITFQQLVSMFKG